MSFLDGLKTIWSDPNIRRTAITSTVIAVGAILAFAMWFLPDMLDGISGRWDANQTINVNQGP